LPLKEDDKTIEIEDEDKKKKRLEMEKLYKDLEK